MIREKLEPMTRCGYCGQIFPKRDSFWHWTWSLCNLRPVDQR